MAYNFNKIARAYDRMNHIMTFGLDRLWRRRAVKELSVFNLGLTVLDVACGTGDMSIELMNFRHCITGIDLSKEMIDIAIKKTEKGEYSFTLYEYQLANAEALPFADGEFNAVTCAFGVRNFVNLEQGLNEMLRVIKPGGRMVILELATPDNKFITPFYNFYTKHVIPCLGGCIAGNRDAYTYLHESITRFPKGESFMKIVQNSKFKIQNLYQRKFFFGVCRMYVFDKG